MIGYIFIGGHWREFAVSFSTSHFFGWAVAMRRRAWHFPRPG